MTWPGLGAWWRDELAGDPAYEEEITPLVLDLLRPEPGRRYLDVGCGEGRLMAQVAASGATAVGVDLISGLLASARDFGPVVRARLPDLACLGDESFDGAYVSLVLEHLDNHRTLLAELARITRERGVLALVVNHPIYTAPESAPIQETDEVLWRPGRYFSDGYTDEPAGEGTVRFHHRTMGELLTSASDAGWDLRRLVEFGVSDAQVERLPALGDQRHIPRLLGASWTRRDR